MAYHGKHPRFTSVILPDSSAAVPSTPPANNVAIYQDSGALKFKNDAGTVTSLLTGNAATLYSAKSADYTITDTDNIRTVGVTTGATERTITLPTVADNTDRIITIKKMDTGVGIVTVDGEGSETIDGATSFVLRRQYDAVSVQSTGTAWVIVSVDVQSRLKRVTVAQEQKTHSADQLAVFNNLVSGERYELKWQFEIDEKATASNTVSLDARQAGTPVAYLSKFVMASGASNHVVNGVWEFTGVTGTLTVNLTTSTTAQKNPSNKGAEYSYIKLVKVAEPLSTTAYD